MPSKKEPGRRCQAQSKQTGEQCKAWAVPGALVCRHHGGNAPQVQRKAAENLAAEAARRAAQTLAVPIDTTPEQALIDEVKRAAGMVAFYQARIEEVDEADRDALVWGMTKHDTSGEFPGPTYEATPNTWLQLWNQERDRLVRVSAAAIKAGIEERRVKLAEQEGALVAAVIRRILDSLNLTPEQSALVPVIVPKELRALTA